MAGPISGEPPAPRRGRLGVLGWPVAHSRSPAMHRAAFSELGLNGWSYQLLPVPPELFDETVRALPAAGFVGANVTLPHKQAALELSDYTSPTALAIGAANTLSFAADGRIYAENTDGPALIASLPIALPGARAVVLGAGGTARSAVWALRAAGAEVAVWNRTPARARDLAEQLGARAIDRVESGDLLCNCTSVGLGAGWTAHEEVLQSLAINTDLLLSYACVVDFVYGGRASSLLDIAREHGVMTVDGATILGEQGALSFELWTGLGAPRTVMAAIATRAA